MHNRSSLLEITITIHERHVTPPPHSHYHFSAQHFGARHFQPRLRKRCSCEHHIRGTFSNVHPLLREPPCCPRFLQPTNIDVYLSIANPPSPNPYDAVSISFRPSTLRWDTSEVSLYRLNLNTDCHRTPSTDFSSNELALLSAMMLALSC